jgi:hypothetical protein
MRQLPRLPAVLRLELEGGGSAAGRLLAATADGPLPLYHFAPLQAAVLSGERIPFAAHWPEYLRLFVYAYLPLSCLKPAQLPPDWPHDFGRRGRDSGGLRPWDQATYRDWPLYLYILDTPGHPPAGEVPHLFERASLRLPPLPPPGCFGQGP